MKDKGLRTVFCRSRPDCSDARHQEKLRKVDYVRASSTPERFSEFIKAEIARWTKIIREANLSVDQSTAMFDCRSTEQAVDT